MATIGLSPGDQQTTAPGWEVLLLVGFVATTWTNPNPQVEQVILNRERLKPKMYRVSGASNSR